MVAVQDLLQIGIPQFNIKGIYQFQLTESCLTVDE